MREYQSDSKVDWSSQVGKGRVYQYTARLRTDKRQTQQGNDIRRYSRRQTDLGDNDVVDLLTHSTYQHHRHRRQDDPNCSRPENWKRPLRRPCVMAEHHPTRLESLQPYTE